MLFNINLFNKILDSCFKDVSSASLAKTSIIFAVIVSAFLVIIKAVAWLMTDSISLLASVNDSCLDALSSFIAFHALKFSCVRYDKIHNFGHEKVEGIVAIFQCLVVIYSGFAIFRESYAIFLDPKPMENTGVGIAVMVVSCVAVYQLIYFQKYVAHRTESMIVRGDSLHYLSDFFMNLCVIASLILSKFFVYVDVVCGLTVGCFVLYNACKIFRGALSDLMDESLPEHLQNKIEETIAAVPGVKSIKILKTRSAGMKKYIESRVIVDDDLNIRDAHNVTKVAEAEVKKLFENVDVIIKAEI
ncbi:MAG: cation diffusion facilitator family transporter [Holosporaceae bacterium]|nr:cation diffusion facilitator family transporter [Holosporaceae bacterium]